MWFKKKVTPREAFIGMCFSMSGIDQFVDPREEFKIGEVLALNGFSIQEIGDVVEKLSNYSPKEAIDWGIKAAEAVSKLDPTMRQNLLKALVEIAAADGKIDSAEETFLVSLRMILT